MVVTLIKSKLHFLQIQGRFFFRDTMEFGQTLLGQDCRFLPPKQFLAGRPP